MDNSKIEELLQEISYKLDDVKNELEEVNKQLVWCFGGTFAEKLIDTLKSIETTILINNR
jgi:hypothetical protein